jgi:hypothetical protein
VLSGSWRAATRANPDAAVSSGSFLVLELVDLCERRNQPRAGLSPGGLQLVCGVGLGGFEPSASSLSDLVGSARHLLDCRSGPDLRIRCSPCGSVKDRLIARNGHAPGSGGLRCELAIYLADLAACDRGQRSLPRSFRARSGSWRLRSWRRFLRPPCQFRSGPFGSLTVLPAR